MATSSYSLGKEYDELNEDVFNIQATWRIYRQLFGTKQERTELVYELVLNFAEYVHWALLESVILGICRVCDPAKQGKNDNLTLEYLVGSLNPPPDATQSGYIIAQFQKIESVTSILRQHRDKRLAHSDLKRAQSTTEILPGVSRQMIEDALAAIRELLSKINDWYLHRTIAYEHPILHGDGDTLIWWLRMGKRLLELQDEAHILTPANKLSDAQLVEKLRMRLSVDDATI